MDKNLQQYQNEICRMCENKFFNGNASSSYHFMCEGRRCEDAYEIFEESDEYLELLVEKRLEIIDKILKDG